MKKQLLAGLAGGLILLCSGAVLAQPYGYGPPPDRQAARNYDIQSRINMQDRMIQRGMRRGELTRGEAAILRDNLNRIRSGYRHATRDGRVDRNEMGRLSEMLDRNDRMIRRMANNDIRRF